MRNTVFMVNQVFIISIIIIITVFMVNQAFCEDTFDGDFGQQLKKGMDELLIVKLWKKGATTEVRVNGVREGVPEYRYELCFLSVGLLGL